MSRAKTLKMLTMGLKNDNYILELRFNNDFYAKFVQKSCLEKLEYFSQLGIIHNKCQCTCFREMSLIKKTKVVDGYIWSCNVCRKEKKCRYGSIFEFIKSPMIKNFKVVHLFCRNSLQNDTDYGLQKSKNTISKWFSNMREIMREYLLETPRSLGGLDINGNNKNCRNL
ncbi:hypothetical protein DMUE_4869 [Dictyocoela muelleri]|nr:hypothetical protein DMUE_4869 [Dictyocoela muelleri]